MTNKAVSTTKAPDATRPNSGLRVVVLAVVLIVPLLLSGIWPILLFSHFEPPHQGKRILFPGKSVADRQKALTQRAQRRGAKDATVAVAKLEALPLRTLRQGFCSVPQWNDGSTSNVLPCDCDVCTTSIHPEHILNNSLMTCLKARKFSPALH